MLLIDLTGHRGKNSPITIILSTIALGLGAAAFTATHATALEFLREIVFLA